ncbi:excalibur calcium-binding domain-containing protein [Comamonas sp. 4034]|uniref:excalibur calcium-binding domain-containing protein n=1 Tax=Comamonas sp. 4034 TaxID=3156455 RepID=UPI003D25D519
MFRLIVFAISLFAAWTIYSQYQAQLVEHSSEDSISTESTEAGSSAIQNSDFQCDGRTRCSQMRSCQEATFFLQNCPNTKMDGDGDGVPCERQLCSVSKRP